MPGLERGLTQDRPRHLWRLCHTLSLPSSTPWLRHRLEASAHRAWGGREVAVKMDLMLP